LTFSISGGEAMASECIDYEAISIMAVVR